MLLSKVIELLDIVLHGFNTWEAEPGRYLSLRLHWTTYFANCKAIRCTGLDLVQKPNEQTNNKKKATKCLIPTLNTNANWILEHVQHSRRMGL